MTLKAGSASPDWAIAPIGTNSTSSGERIAIAALWQIFPRQRRGGRLGLHHDARNSPAAGFFDRLNAVDAACDLLAVDVQRVAAP